MPPNYMDALTPMLAVEQTRQCCVFTGVVDSDKIIKLAVDVKAFSCGRFESNEFCHLILMCMLLTC